MLLRIRLFVHRRQFIDVLAYNRIRYTYFINNYSVRSTSDLKSQPCMQNTISGKLPVFVSTLSTAHSNKQIVMRHQVASGLTSTLFSYVMK